MQYQGGKSRIASHIAAKIREMYPTATEIWEPFCGGGAVTLALAKAGFKVHASDSHEDLILMWQALMRGETEPFADVTEAEYAALKAAAPSSRRGFVGFGASFGGGWWSGYGRKDEAHVRDFVWQSSQIWLRQQKWPHLDIAFNLADYTSTPDHVLVYADPPYQGTKPYKGAPAFDHVAFWSWVRRRQGPTFVSELSGPDDIDIVWRKQHKSQNASNSPTTKATAKVIEREERLYWHRGCGGETSARRRRDDGETIVSAPLMSSPWHRRVVDALSTPPTVLYHATTPRKLTRYVATGAILPPVRGFDTLEGVQEWARLTNGRTVILKFEVEHAQALPDHHNVYGLAWWTPVAVHRWTVIQG